MSILLFVVIAANAGLFLGIGAWAWRQRADEDSPRIRVLAGALAAVSVAFVLSAVTRLVGVAVRVGWLDGRVGDFIVSEWHLVQSLGATALGLLGIILLRSHVRSIRSADRIAAAVSDRLLDGATIEELGLTNRETEVLQAIADGHVSDAEIAEALFIAPATAGTHVKNILRKAGVKSRRELALLVASSEL